MYYIYQNKTTPMIVLVHNTSTNTYANAISIVQTKKFTPHYHKDWKPFNLELWDLIDQAKSFKSLFITLETHMPECFV